MVGTKWWGAFILFGILLNISSFIMNLIVGHFIWLPIAILCILMLAWSYQQNQHEVEARQRAQEFLEEQDVA